MGPLTGVRVLDASTILAGPLACQVLGDFGADVIKVEHPVAGDGMRGHGPAKDGVPIWWKEISRNKRTIGLSLKDPDGADIFRALARPGRRGRGELPSRHPRAVGTGPGRAARAQPRARPAPHHRLRPDRSLRLARRLRHPGRGDERLRPPHRPRRRPARPCRPSAWPTRSPASPPPPPSRWPSSPASATAAQGQVIDLNLLDPIMTAVGPGPTVYQQTGEVGHAARQPLHQQRPAQHLPHLRRPLGGDLHQRPGHRRAGDAPGRPPRGDRRAVVRRRPLARGARRRARRDGRRLDRRPDPRRGGRRPSPRRARRSRPSTPPRTSSRTRTSARRRCSSRSRTTTSDPSCSTTSCGGCPRRPARSGFPAASARPGHRRGARRPRAPGGGADAPPRPPRDRVTPPPRRGPSTMTSRTSRTSRRRPGRRPPRPPRCCSTPCAPAWRCTTWAAPSPSGCRSPPTTRRTGTRCRAGTATWCGPTAGPPPTT